MHFIGRLRALAPTRIAASAASACDLIAPICCSTKNPRLSLPDALSGRVYIFPLARLSRFASVRSRSAFSLMNPAASLWS